MSASSAITRECPRIRQSPIDSFLARLGIVRGYQLQLSVHMRLVVLLAACTRASEAFAAIPNGAKLIPWKTARAAVQRLGFKEQDEWEEWVMDNKPGITSRHHWLMPDEPDVAYVEWAGWDDWLGVPLGYNEAREVVKKLGVKSQEMWWAYSREHADELLSLRVPSRPHLHYKGDWKGYDRWLSLPDTPLTLPSSYWQDGSDGSSDDAL